MTKNRCIGQKLRGGSTQNKLRLPNVERIRSLLKELQAPQSRLTTGRMDENGDPVPNTAIHKSVMERIFGKTEYRINSINQLRLASFFEVPIEEIVLPLDDEPHLLSQGEGGNSVHNEDVGSPLPPLSSYFVGRCEALGAIDGAWQSRETKIIGVVGVGGVGKSALVSQWLQGVRKGPRRHRPDRIYQWSFAHQGHTAGLGSASDEFISAALGAFGDPNPDAGHWRGRAQRLVSLIGKQPTILILDGFEVLQQSSINESPGFLHLGDAVRELLGRLTEMRQVLCIITSREGLRDLEAYRGTRYTELRLSGLSAAEGESLLRDLGIEGTPSELQAVAERFDGHPLCISLVASLIRSSSDRLGLGSLPVDLDLTVADQWDAGLADRIMRQYETRLSDAEIQAIGVFSGSIEFRVG